MKIAVLITGDYRNFDAVVHTYDFFLTGADIYVSCWDSSHQVNPFDSSVCFHLDNITEEHIRNTLAKYSIGKILVEPYLQEKWIPGQYVYNEQMCHRWRVGMDSINESGISYDFIIVVRPDLVFNSHIIPIDFAKLDTNTLYSHWFNKDILHMPDPIFIGSQNNINETLISPKEWRLLNYFQGDWHKAMYEYIVKMKRINVSNADTFLPGMVFARPPITKNSTFPEAVRYHREWNHLNIRNQRKIFPIEQLCEWWGESEIRKLFPEDFPTEVSEHQP